MPYHTGNTRTVEEVRRIFNQGFEGDVAFTNEQFFQAFLPKVHINKATVETSDNNEFIFDIDLEMRMPVVSMPFFSDGMPEIKNFLRARIYLIRENKELFEKFLILPSTTAERVLQDLAVQEGDEVRSRTKTLADVLGTPQSSITQKVYDDVTYKIYPFSVKFRETVPVWEKTFGVVTYSTFEFNSGDVFSSDNNSEMEESQRDALLILDKGNVSSTSYSYVTEGGENWDGPVHLMDNRSIMTGFTHNQFSVPLTRITNQVNKVQDFRVSKIFDPLSNTEGSLAEPYISISKSDSNRVRIRTFENNIFNDLRKSLYKSESVLLPDKKQTYFSDFHMSRDELGQCRFFFSINWKRIILENSLFGKFLDKAGEDLNVLLQACQIMSMKIERIRVKGSSETGSRPDVDKFSLFDENEVYETVVISKDNEQGTLNPRSSNPNDNSPGIEELNILPVYGNTLRHFSGVDAGVSKKTDGFYKYKVSLEVKDGSKDNIIDRAQAMREIITDITKYYNSAIYYTSPGVRINPNDSPYIQGPDSDPPGEPIPSNYDPKTKTFSDSFWTKTDYPTVNNIKELVEKFVQQYLFFNIFNSNDNFLNGQQMENTFKSYLTDSSLTTPYTMETALNIMDNIVLRIEKYIDDVFTGSSVYRNLNDNAERSELPSGKVKTFLVENVSDYFFEAMGSQKIGFDFLGTVNNLSARVLDANQGVKKISGEFYNNRIDAEKQTIFKDPAGFNSFSQGASTFFAPEIEKTEKVYFSPLAIYLPDQQTPIKGNERSQYLKVYSNSLRKSINEKSTIEGDITGQINASNENILLNTLRRYLTSEFNVEVVAENNSSIDSTTRSLIDGANAVDSFELGVVQAPSETQPINGSKLLFSISRQCLLENNKKDITSQDKNYSNSYYNLKDTNSEISKKIDSPNGLQISNIINNAPMQTKALFYYADKAQFLENNLKLSYEDLKDPANYCYFIYKTQILNKIEMLIGYDANRDGQVLLRSPLWRTHNEANFSNLSGPFFCKSVPYNNELYQIERNKNFVLPTYDEYFILNELLEGASDFVITADPWAATRPTSNNITPDFTENQNLLGGPSTPEGPEEPEGPEGAGPSRDDRDSDPFESQV